MKLVLVMCLVGLASSAWTEYEGCGVSDVEDAGAERRYMRIVGGWEVEPHEYPYQTSLKALDGDFFCGGSIIDDQRVLTAAHCTEGLTASMIRVGLGEHYLNTGDEFVLASVSNIRMHEYYNPVSIENDVAVLTLNDDIEINHARRPVCPSERTDESNADSYAGQRLIVSGWGTISETGPTTIELRAVYVEGLSFNQCKYDTLYDPTWILAGMMCAGVPEGGKDACSGDSGGPLVYQRSDGRFEEVGIVSWGEGCARAGYPGVYSDVLYYIDWI